LSYVLFLFFFEQRNELTVFPAPKTEDITDLNWLFLDLNSYFASVEQQAQPALRGRPVIVTPVDSPYTSAIAASYEAKAMGIGTGISVREAKQRCPDIAIVLARHDVYVDYHHRIIHEIEQHLHVTKVCSIDEVACVLLGPERLPDNAVQLALAVQKGIMRNVGQCLTSSVGIASSRLLAKTASDMKKPNGLTVITRDSLPGPLLRLKLTDIAGIASGIERRLNHCGIHTVEAFWNLSPNRARAVWGSIEGERFWYGLHGIDPPDIITKRGSISHSHVLAPDLRPPAMAHQVARRLVVKAASRMRQTGYRTAGLSLSTRSETRMSWGSDCCFPITDNTFALLRHLDHLWSERPRMSADEPIKKVGIVLHKLTLIGSETPDLFAQDTETRENEKRDNPKMNKKEQALSAALDRLNQRFGKDSVLIGPSAKLPNYVGAKIAFNRIPEPKDFLN
jgi:DNA polymerase IV